MKLKRESLPARCEVCHQIDLFDASENYCQRCGDIGLSIEPSPDIQLITRILIIKRLLLVIFIIGPVAIYLSGYHVNLGVLCGLASLCGGIFSYPHSGCIDLVKQWQQRKKDHTHYLS